MKPTVYIETHGDQLPHGKAQPRFDHRSTSTDHARLVGHGTPSLRGVHLSHCAGRDIEGRA